jgi:nucleotide-binding universal stress UspA family protein
LETIIRRKLLLLVDGSDQALEAVRYISSAAAPDRTELVLFHVGSGFPEVFWDLNGNPLYRAKKPKVMGWLADHQLAIGEFKEKAIKILSIAGFTDDAVSVKTQTQKTGILADILQESYQGYGAVVVGRTGTSRLKDRFAGSLAYKLIKRIRHVPTVVVAGKPVSRRVMILLDASLESMRGVSSFGSVAAAKDLNITVCHCLDQAEMLPMKGGGRRGTIQNEPLWRKYYEDRFQPVMDEAFQRLLDAGIPAQRITRTFLEAKGDREHKLISAAVVEGFGTIVVGRPDTSGRRLRLLRRRFSEEIIKSINDAAVWVVG